MKRWMGNLGAFAGSAAVMALLFELACRTVLNTGSQYHIEMWKYAVQLKRISANPEIGHEHVPGGHARLMDAEVSINADGLRDREHAKAKAPGEVRIMMLGDSTMFGWGVKQDETIAKHVEQFLNSQAPDTFVEVINTGVGNYNTAMEVAYFLERGVAFKPDVVVLNYFINDAEPTPVYRDVPSHVTRMPMPCSAAPGTGSSAASPARSRTTRPITPASMPRRAGIRRKRRSPNSPRCVVRKASA